MNSVGLASGKYGACCAEFDIWEANKYAQAYTTHPCINSGQTSCTGTSCGGFDSVTAPLGTCNRDGCAFQPWQLWDKNFYGPGPQFTVNNTEKPMTVVTQFITTDGTDNGDLKEIRHFYIQDENASTTLAYY